MVEPSEELQVVFEKAIKDDKKLRHEYVTLEHLFFAMLCSENFAKVLDGYGCKVDAMKQELNDHLQNKMDEIKVADTVKNYKPKKFILNWVKKNNRKINIFHEPKIAVKNADVVFSDKVISLNDKVNIKKKMKDFRKFHIDTKLLKLAPKSIALYNKWLAAGYPVELHMYAKGGHGYGMGTQNLPVDTWYKRYEDWLTQYKYLNK